MDTYASIRRIRFTAAVLVCVATASLVAAQPDRNPALSLVGGPFRDGIVLFASGGDRWFWTHASGGQETLFEGGPGRAPVSLATGSGWSALAWDGQALWLTQQQRDQGHLCRLRPGRDVTPEKVVSGLAQPSGLFADNGRLYWLENRAPRAAAFRYIPTEGWTAILRMRDGSGAVRTLAEWPGGGPSGTELPAQDLLGVTEDYLFCRVRRPASTEFLRIALADGKAERVAVESGSQSAVLYEGTLFWTAPSDEASPATGMRCVRTLGSAGNVVLVGDWLPENGVLLGTPQGVRFASDGWYALRGRAPAERLPGSLSGRVVADQDQLFQVGGTTPVAVQVEDEGYVR